MPTSYTVGTEDEIPEGEGRAYPVDGTMVAVFRVDGELHAINDFCPHMGASLSAGAVEGKTVMCPWHAWEFDIQTGCWTENPGSPLKCAVYGVKVVDGQVQIEVPDPPAVSDDE